MSPYVPLPHDVRDHLRERAATIAEAEGLAYPDAARLALSRLSALLLEWGEGAGVVEATEALRVASSGEVVEALTVMAGLYHRV